MLFEVTVNEISARETADKLSSENPCLLIDCREKDEYEESHIEEARFLPLSNFSEQLQQSPELKEWPADQDIVVYCRSGARSLQACSELMEAGFSQVSNLCGGILAWQQEGLPIKP